MNLERCLHGSSPFPRPPSLDRLAATRAPMGVPVLVLLATVSCKAVQEAAQSTARAGSRFVEESLGGVTVASGTAAVDTETGSPANGDDPPEKKASKAAMSGQRTAKVASAKTGPASGGGPTRFTVDVDSARPRCQGSASQETLAPTTSKHPELGLVHTLGDRVFRHLTPVGITDDGSALFAGDYLDEAGETARSWRHVWTWWTGDRVGVAPNATYSSWNATGRMEIDPDGKGASWGVPGVTPRRLLEFEAELPDEEGIYFTGNARVMDQGAGWALLTFTAADLYGKSYARWMLCSPTGEVLRDRELWPALGLADWDPSGTYATKLPPRSFSPETVTFAYSYEPSEIPGRIRARWRPVFVSADGTTRVWEGDEAPIRKYLSWVGDPDALDDWTWITDDDAWGDSGGWTVRVGNKGNDGRSGTLGLSPNGDVQFVRWPIPAPSSEGATLEPCMPTVVHVDSLGVLTICHRVEEADTRPAGNARVQPSSRSVGCETCSHSLHRVDWDRDSKLEIPLDVEGREFEVGHTMIPVPGATHAIALRCRPSGVLLRLNVREKALRSSFGGEGFFTVGSEGLEPLLLPGMVIEDPDGASHTVQGIEGFWASDDGAYVLFRYSASDKSQRFVRMRLPAIDA